MLWLAAACESLDDEHASAAAGAWTRQHARLVGCRGLRCVGLFGTDRHGEQLACPSDVGGAGAARQQSVVTDAVEAAGQHVDQEAPNELVRCERHGFPAARTFDAIVLPAERHATVIGGDEPAIGDGDAVGVARQIGEHGLRSAERTLGIDHPIDLA